ncbi:hypothetical protein [Saccharibacillus alkalitolerans]|uniref:Uncharacterized protein n=1 Tax=Saccharibacillus alkalitolerans TaxID=2705290 RepID=A0ABX0FDS3_9BACL|nr:hypothetical protein [Saccharibacillus alkalitolerans]NGZ77786.1 hypothetical protein [Saccharibacillus alkalitolerans]
MNHPAQMFLYNARAAQTPLNRIGELPSSVRTREVGTSFPTIAEAFSPMYAVEMTWYWGPA